MRNEFNDYLIEEKLKILNKEDKKFTK